MFQPMSAGFIPTENFSLANFHCEIRPSADDIPPMSYVRSLYLPERLVN